MASDKTYKFPTALGECADLLYTLKAKRLAGQKAVDEVESEEKALKEHLINTLPKSEASGVAGKLARVTLVPKLIPQIKNFDIFWAYVKKSGRTDLMQRRLADSAVKELWDAGKVVPGVEGFSTVSISLNKV